MTSGSFKFILLSSLLMLSCQDAQLENAAPTKTSHNKNPAKQNEPVAQKPIAENESHMESKTTESLPAKTDTDSSAGIPAVGQPKTTSPGTDENDLQGVVVEPEDPTKIDDPFEIPTPDEIEHCRLMIGINPVVISKKQVIAMTRSMALILKLKKDGSFVIRSTKFKGLRAVFKGICLVGKENVKVKLRTSDLSISIFKFDSDGNGDAEVQFDSMQDLVHSNCKKVLKHNRLICK